MAEHHAVRSSPRRRPGAAGLLAMLASAFPGRGLRLRRLPMPLVAVGVGALGGAALVVASPLVLFAIMAGGVAAVIMLRSPQSALLAAVGVISLLPFAVVPLRLGVQLTFLDATLTIALLVAVLGWLRMRRLLVPSPLNALL